MNIIIFDLRVITGFQQIKGVYVSWEKIVKNLVTSFFLLVPLAVAAQGEYNQFYEIENLLSKELIKSVAKDKDGYLWIATDDGVLRYDGYQTNLFYRDLPSPFTKGFLKRQNGQFYVVSDFGMVEIVETNDSIYFKSFSRGGKVFDERLNYPKSAYEDLHGDVWVGEMSALTRYSDNGSKRFDLGEDFRSINYHRTFSFVEDAFGNLWIAPFKGPLLFYNRQADALEAFELSTPISEVCGIANVKGDYLLIGGKEGLLKIKVDSDHRILETVFNSEIKNISTVRCIRNEHIYVGTWTEGLYYQRVDLPSSQFEKVTSVAFSDILDLYFDINTNELWVVGSENLGLLKSSIVSSVQAVGQNRIESVALDESHGIYYSIGEKMFYLDNIGNGSSKHILSSEDTYFERLLFEKDKIWIGDAFGAIFYYDVKTGQKKSLLEGTVNFSIQYLMKDRSGNKWFTGHSRGLIRIDSTGTLKVYEDMNQTVLTRESPAGELFSSSNGKVELLSRYDPSRDKFTNINLTFNFDAHENIAVNDFQFDPQGNLWLATDEGLLRVHVRDKEGEGEKVSIVGLNENEPVRAVTFVDDYLCFATSMGLVIFKDGEYILFTQDSGLPSKILQERGIMEDHNGNLLILTSKGLAFIDKGAIQFRPTAPPQITTLMINGLAVPQEGAETVVYPFKTKVEAEFIALSYPATNIMYQTRIIGIDDDWSFPSTSRNLNVLGFSEGEYTIQIRAREDGKLWSEPLSLTLSIGKPWYGSWWAIGSFIVLGVVTVILATQIHNNNLIRQKRRLQKIVEERTEKINQQKNEIIEQQKKLIQQKEELIAKNDAVYKSQQALVEADMNYLQLKEKQLQDQIEYKNKQITTHALNILQKNETLMQLRSQLEEIVKNGSKISITEIRRTLKTIDESFKLDKDWEDFKFYFEQIHTGFYAKLNINYPELTPLELRHCALIRLNLTLAECASILGISHDSLKVSRTRLRKKLNLDPNQSLTEFVMGI